MFAPKLEQNKSGHGLGEQTKPEASVGGRCQEDFLADKNGRYVDIIIR